MEKKYDIKFEIACCDACSEIFIDKALNKGRKRNIILNRLKRNFKLKESTDEVFVIAKTIFNEGLDNDKYGVNNLKIE